MTRPLTDDPEMLEALQDLVDAALEAMTAGRTPSAAAGSPEGEALTSVSQMTGARTSGAAGLEFWEELADRGRPAAARKTGLLGVSADGFVHSPRHPGCAQRCTGGRDG